MAERKAYDWEAIEKHYRAGIRTLRDIAAEFGCSHVAIQKKAKAEKWVRDLSAKIKAAADAKVTREAVTNQVTTVTKITEQEIIEANANLQYTVTLAHRKDITRFRALALSLLEELEQQSGNPELFNELGELLKSGDSGKLSDACAKVMSLPSRVDSVKKLAETLKTLIGLERQAFGLDNGDEAPKEQGAIPAEIMSMFGYLHDAAHK